MGRKGSFILAALLLSFSLFGEEEFRIVPNYGHLESVISLEWDKEENVLLSLGKDSHLLAIDLTENRVQNRLALSGLPVLSRLNPAFPEIALVTEKGNRYELTLLNWQTGRILLQREEKQIPFFLEYSRSGEILLIGEEKIEFLSHDQGETLEGPEEVTDLLTYGYLGGSEKTFMGYSPSGTLIYYDRYSSQILGRVETEEDLTDLAVLTTDVRLLTARKGNSIYLINRQSGEVLDTLDGEEILSYHCQSDEGILTILSVEMEEDLLTSYRIRRDRFSRITEKEPETTDLTFALYGEEAFLVGNEKGELLLSQRKSRQVLQLLPGRPLTIDRVALIHNQLLIGSGEELFAWESPFFEKAGLSTNYLLNLSRHQLSLPLAHSEILNFLGEAVFWEPDSQIKYPYYLLGENFEWTTLNQPEETQPTDESTRGFTKEVSFGYGELSFYEDLEVLLSEDKNCRVSRLNKGEEGFLREELYTYTHPSLETAAMVSPSLLALGTNTYFGGRNSVNITDIFTGESIPLSDDRTVVTSFLPNREGTGFYSFGFAEREGFSYGQVKYHDLENLFEEPETVLEFPQITNDECIMSLGGEDQVYVTTPEGQWYSSGQVKPGTEAHSLDRVVSHNNYLYRIERDHSLVICREDNLEVLARVHFFEGGEWLAQREENRYFFHSSEARDYFTVYKIKN
ncbi:MAG: hypothetical protein PQJ59_01565 [Spirochaetales bacterium]|nr:hypothetical protein [Spirochaetales bacterium]